jgi:hypothetical protein
MTTTVQDLEKGPEDFPYVPPGMETIFLEPECGRQFRLKFPGIQYAPEAERKAKWFEFHTAFMDKAVEKGLLAGWYSEDEAMFDCRTIDGARLAVEKFSLKGIDSHRRNTCVYYPMALSNEPFVLNILESSVGYDPR